MDVRYRLLRRTVLNADAKCQRCRRPLAPGERGSGDVPVRRTDRGAWLATGLVTCGKFTCPSCGPYEARLTMGALGAGIEKWCDRSRLDGKTILEDTRDVWMLTLNAPHYAWTPQKMIVDGIFAAWRWFTKSRAWERFCEEFGVAAVVRVFDATHQGENGLHAHFHVALFVDKAPPGFRYDRAIARRSDPGALLRAAEILGGFLGNEREAGDWYARGCGLRDAWEAAVRKSIGIRPSKLAHFRKWSLQLAGGEDAAGYFTKWGLADETAGTVIKSDSHLVLLDLAGAGDEVAGEKYVKFCKAMAGKQWVSGLGDMMRKIGIDQDAVTAFLAAWRAKRDEIEPPTLVKPLSATIRAAFWSRALHVGLGAVFAELDRADLEGVEDLQGYLDRLLIQVDMANPSPTWRDRTLSMRS